MISVYHCRVFWWFNHMNDSTDCSYQDCHFQFNWSITRFCFGKYFWQKQHWFHVFFDRRFLVFFYRVLNFFRFIWFQMIHHYVKILFGGIDIDIQRSIHIKVSKSVNSIEICLQLFVRIQFVFVRVFKECFFVEIFFNEVFYRFFFQQISFAFIQRFRFLRIIRNVIFQIIDDFKVFFQIF